MSFSSPTPLVSVVIPTYAPAAHLSEALASASQQIGVATEILVIDDASPTDLPVLDTVNVTTIRRAKNGGPAAAHNTGIHAARGEFIAFLEHDDIFLPEKLEKQVAALRANPAWAACYCAFEEMDETGKTLGAPPQKLISGAALLPVLLDGNCILSLSLVVARREKLLEVGGLDESFRIAGDYDLWLRLASSGREIGAIGETLLRYRRHAQSLGARQRVLGLEETLCALEKLGETRPELAAQMRDHKARCWLRLGKIHRENKNFEAAHACLERAQKLRPFWWKTRRELWRLSRE